MEIVITRGATNVDAPKNPAVCLPAPSHPPKKFSICLHFYRRKELNTTMRSHANIVTLRNAIPLTPQILSPSKKKFVTKISSKNVLLSTKKVPVKKQWNFVTRL